MMHGAYNVKLMLFYWINRFFFVRMFWKHIEIISRQNVWAKCSCPEPCSTPFIQKSANYATGSLLKKKISVYSSRLRDGETPRIHNFNPRLRRMLSVVLHSFQPLWNTRYPLYSRVDGLQKGFRRGNKEKSSFVAMRPLVAKLQVINFIGWAVLILVIWVLIILTSTSIHLPQS